MENLYKNEISKILEELGKELDISRTQYEEVVKSYETVGSWLADDTSSLKEFSPKIVPQGSFMLGTLIKPICEDDDIDVDLVCRLNKKPDSWSQRHLKQAIGDRLKEHGTYDYMLKEYDDRDYYEEGGRRCWTLKYADAAGYHMDILPSFANDGLTILLEKTFSTGSDLDTDNLAMRITDREKDGYDTDKDVENWLKSNPFGYAKWFFEKALLSTKRMFSLNESVDPIRIFESEKLPLQRVVQLLKRHRDIMFSSDKYDSENKPISIIITTLASRAYDKSENIIDAYTNIVRKMRGLIEERENPETGKLEKWVANPVNMPNADYVGENFADKWSYVKQKEDYFYLWLDKLEEDLKTLRNSQGIGLQFLNESMTDMYGKTVTNKTFANYAKISTIERHEGTRKMANKTGFLGAVGSNVPEHNFEGNNGE
ncbi:nucleotidyltransferase domain-containing protein [Winogradskyella bathintestinalis]|uniref:Nucleotidyltransferase n=1 Tax=Winogradskyella bathintestinalis TaxID=3035208 RepID=A0ABT7ZWX2_9FLAO|nr:nucleotidyltransferase [Winogradskyella bathintestinalis]MDN3493506.1 nucleotidyltransferase [Winogradskyella bathintestinalis]